MEFEGFPKMARYSRDIIITEKIDGTNAQILIEQDGTFLVGSRNRWITPEDDNFGFARWAYSKRDELTNLLGPGRHFGEWWGQGIQRNYGLKEKRFSLFNVGRWNEETKPPCCYVVPILYQGPWDGSAGTQFPIIEATMVALATTGSRASPGFMKPEGIVIYHTAKGFMFKKTFEKDGGKWQE